MNKIVSKEYFSENVIKFEVEAPLIARSRKAGHFVMVKVGAKGERIPLTIADADTSKGTITLVEFLLPNWHNSTKVMKLPTWWVRSDKPPTSKILVPWYAPVAAWAPLLCFPSWQHLRQPATG